MPKHTFPLDKHSGKPYIPVRLSNPQDDYEKHITYALLDTGADTSIVPYTVGRDLMHNNENPEVESRPVFGIGGSVSTFKHTFNLEVLDLDFNVLFEIKGMMIEVLPRETGHSTPVILGRDDFIRHYVTSINFEKNSIEIRY